MPVFPGIKDIFMKQQFFYIISFFCLLLGACKKDLNAPPPNARVNGTAVTDLNSAQVTLNGVYYRFANATPILYDWQQPNIHSGMLTGMLGYGFGAYSDETNLNLTSRFMAIKNPWNVLYATIVASNGFIEGLNDLPEGVISPTRKLEMYAEARFLRAYSNFKLLMFFSEWKDLGSKNGVLLRNELTALSNVVKARSTVAESYTAILGDLDDAVANGPTNNPNYFVNKYAAMILQARVLLTRGETADITKALDLANQVIGSGKYSLENNLKDIFHVKGLASAEVILGIKPQAQQETKRESMSGNYYMPFGTYASFAYVAKGAFKDLLIGDPRQAWMIGPVNPSASSPNTFAFSKYLPYVAGAATEPTQLSEVSYAIRLSEAYLLKAEALARSNGSLTDAKTAIKTVMARAGIPAGSALYNPIDNATTSEQVWEQAYLETLRNFTGEDAIVWFALLRFPLAKIMQIRPSITSVNLLWFGVPVAEFQQNPLFGSQNAGGYPTQ